MAPSALVPPKHSVVLRSAAELIVQIIRHREILYFRQHLARGLDELSRKQLLAVPVAVAQVELAKARHRIDIGVNSGIELAAFDAVDSVGTVQIIAPSDIESGYAD